MVVNHLKFTINAQMKELFNNVETQFEKVTSYLMGVFGYYVTFFIAIAVVYFWLTQAHFFNQS